MNYYSAPTPRVFAPVISLAFSSSQYDDCKNFLADRTANTECVPIVDEAQLLLSADGRLVESSYRFNPIGFDAVSRNLCAGLTALFNDLSGESHQGVLSEERPASLPAAVGVYNAALRVRFNSLRERTLLVDHQEQSIDGFLGIDHRFLDNSAFFNLVSQGLLDAQPSAEFSRAEIIGRELRLFFIDPSSRRDDIHPDKEHSFAAGWYFSNREDAGNAIRASRCVFTKFGPAISPASAATKVVHSGSDLVGRTGVLIARVAEHSVDMAVVEKSVRALLQMPLGFTDVRSEFDATQQKWADYLARFKVKTDLAKTISKNAEMVGADLAPRNPIEVYTRAGLSSRTGYDLLCSILRQSRHEYATYRDSLQSVAMRFLTSDVSLNKRFHGEENHVEKRTDRHYRNRSRGGR